MCSIESHDRIHPTVNYYTSSGGGRPILFESTIYVLVSFGIALNLISNWLQYFRKPYLWRTALYGDKMSELFKIISVTIPELNPDNQKNKR